MLLPIAQQNRQNKAQGSGARTGNLTKTRKVFQPKDEEEEET